MGQCIVASHSASSSRAAECAAGPIVARTVCAAARRGGCARAGAAVFFHRRRNDGAIDRTRAVGQTRGIFSERRSRRDRCGMRMGGGSDAYGETYGCVHYVEWIVGLSTTRSGIPVASARCKRMAQRESRTADMNQTVPSKSASLCLCENGHGIHMAQMRRCRRSSIEGRVDAPRPEHVLLCAHPHLFHACNEMQILMLPRSTPPILNMRIQIRQAFDSIFANIQSIQKLHKVHCTTYLYKTTQLTHSLRCTLEHVGSMPILNTDNCFLVCVLFLFGGMFG